MDVMGNNSDLINNNLNDIQEYGILYDDVLHKNLFHGTRKYIAEEISRTKKIVISEEIGYLGIGFYCYLYDKKAAEIFAKRKYQSADIGVINISANFKVILFVFKELYNSLKERANLLISKDINLGNIRECVGYLLEIFIKEINRIFQCEIKTVAQAYVVNRKKDGRPAMMYSIRDVNLITDMIIC